MSVTRRSFGVGAAAAAAGVLFGQPSMSAQALPSPRPKGLSTRLELLGSRAHVFDVNFQAARPVTDVRGVRVEGSRRQLSGAQLRIEYDTRLLRASDGSVYAFSDGVREILRPDLSRSSAGVLSFELPHLSGSPADPATVFVSVPLALAAAYPNENIGVPAETRASLGSPRSSAPSATASAKAGPPVRGQAWGGELSAVWSEVEVRGSRAYSYPAFLRLDSVGPAPIPAGARVHVLADPAITGLSVERVFTGDTPHGHARSSPARAETPTSAGIQTFTLQSSLAAGASLSIAFQPVPRTRGFSSAEIAFSRVWLQGPTDSPALQRVTGLEAAVAVSGSGLPLAQDPFTGTI